jgi:hypothetical protein
MSEMKTAEVTVIVRIPYDEHDEAVQHAIDRRARDISGDNSFLASWLGVDADDLTDNENFYATARVKFEV